MSEYAIERVPPPARSFELGGHTWHCRRGKVPMALLFNVADLIGGSSSDAFAMIAGLRHFLEQMVTRDERESFRTFLMETPEDDEDPAVYDVQDLQRVVTQLVEQIANVPFEPPSSSPSSPPANGASSAASSDSAESTSLPIRRMQL